MTEKQFFEQWNRIYAAGDIDIPERLDWREVRYMLAYLDRDEMKAKLDEAKSRPLAFVTWCAENYWSLNSDFWKAQNKMLEELYQMAATKLIN
jgi:hypothetical protein